MGYHEEAVEVEHDEEVREELAVDLQQPELVVDQLLDLSTIRPRR